MMHITYTRVCIEQPLLVSLVDGAPRVHISNVRLVGLVRVAGSELRLTACAFEAAASGPQQKGLSTSLEASGLTISGGHAVLTQVALNGFTYGAISVHTARLTLVQCTIQACHAPSGGAMLVSGGAIVRIERSIFANNSATVSGGAIQVEDAIAADTSSMTVIQCT
eukprot:2417902-Prymnesium_polylepis.1